jgi:TPR repeat protein
MKRTFAILLAALGLLAVDAQTAAPQAGAKPADTSPAAIRARAEDGSVVDQFLLGGSYAWGEDGVPQDNVQAYKWMSLAAQRGSGPTRDFYAANRDMVAEKMTPEQIAEAKTLAREWVTAFEKRQRK